MAKPIVRVSFAKLPSQNPLAMKLKAAATPKPKPKPAAKAPLKATAAEAAAIGRANRSQAMEAREMQGMKRRPAPQIIRTMVNERTTPTKKRP
jgi:hypothetical protein